MLKTETTAPENFRRLFGIVEARHPWVSLYDRHVSRSFPEAELQLTPAAERTRLDVLLPILRCPTSGQKLGYCERRTALAGVDGATRWPIVEGRPCLAANMPLPAIQPRDHISNALPDEAQSIIREAKGWVLNLSAGGTKERFDHVVEVEYAIFRNTDVVADAHALPFDDATFDAAIVMNAFEHYRDPGKVASELFRVLKPGGRLHVRTAFLRPLHERSWRFYNCTRYGMVEWFKAFETETLRVSDNFCPNHSIAWLASECEGALRNDVSSDAADEFAMTAVGSLAQMWRDPSKRDGPVWRSFERLPQSSQEAVAAGFEFIGRRPADDSAPIGGRRSGKP
jgi:SAM-dependent methyltransferase